MSGSRQHTIKRWKTMFDNGWKFICGICKLPITRKDQLSIDHIHPKSLGGKNHRNNYQPAHAKCNSRRGSKPLEQVVKGVFEEKE